MNQRSLPQFISHLALPPANLAKLSFSASKAAKVKEWADQLRATQTGETGAVLYKCLPEVARLKCSFENRLEILEALRPVTQHTIEGLTRDFLNQPVHLSQNAQKTAIVAQAIQKGMIDGYTRCILDICAQKRFKPVTRDLLAKALQRAITGVGLIFFRSYQLYTQPPADFWLQLHSFFQVAHYFDLLASPIKDPLLKSKPAINIQSAYVRVLVLATARLNQLNQNDIEHIYNALESWAQFVRLHAAANQDKNNFFIVNLDKDQAPCYKSRFDGSEQDRVLEIDFKVLVNQLAKQSPSEDNTDIDINTSGAITIPQGFPAGLLEHLISSWSSIAQRRQERRAVNTSAEVSIGMVNTHYLVCGETPFDTFANDSGLGEEFSGSVVDVLTADLSNTGDNKRKKTDTTHMVTLQNISAGGCCVVWKGNMPGRLKAGEVIGMKESGRRSWSLGVVRWVRQYRESSQLGIQILANHPKPYGIAQMYDMGGYSDYMRAFYLPPSKNGQTPASLLTAVAPFQELDKVKVFDGDNAITAKLNKVLFSTGTVKQFMFNPLDADKSATPAPGTPGRQAPPVNDTFDDDWD